MDVLERGEIRFAYRPRVGQAHATRLDEVQRFFALLAPEGGAIHRRLVIGRKRLPDPDAHERYWAFVDRVGATRSAIESDLGEEVYRTRSRGWRRQAAARPLGQGVYAIVGHRDHSHLSYRLSPSVRPGPLHAELGIEERASYVAAVMNPGEPPPAGAGGHAARYPRDLAERFAGRRFAPLVPAFLDHEGAELVLVGASSSPDAALGAGFDFG